MKLYNQGIGALIVLAVIIDSCDAYIDNSNFDRQRENYRAWMQEDQSIWLEDQASFLRQYEDTNEEAWSNVITSAEKYVPELSQLRTDFDFQEKKSSYIFIQYYFFINFTSAFFHLIFI